ncbi:hypothetical protein BGZ50_009291 [Haplosporangium sp. Z 11]|nr:hypothetical protein BGZ50_009291 [Haplosporangium sp. Z 11]
MNSLQNLVLILTGLAFVLRVDSYGPFAVGDSLNRTAPNDAAIARDSFTFLMSRSTCTSSIYAFDNIVPGRPDPYFDYKSQKSGNLYHHNKKGQYLFIKLCSAKPISQKDLQNFSNDVVGYTDTGSYTFFGGLAGKACGTLANGHWYLEDGWIAGYYLASSKRDCLAVAWSREGTPYCGTSQDLCGLTFEMNAKSRYQWHPGYSLVILEDISPPPPSQTNQFKTLCLSRAFRRLLRKS